MNWYKKSEDLEKAESEMSEDEFINHHKTHDIPPIKTNRSGDVFKWYHRKNYPDIITKDIFNGVEIIFCHSDEDPDKIVAFDKERAIGIASNHFDSHLSEGEFGDGYWVDKEYQHRGIGLRLMELFRSRSSINNRIGEMSPSGENLARAYHRRVVERSKE